MPRKHVSPTPRRSAWRKSRWRGGRTIPKSLGTLGLALAGLGEREAAVQQARRAVELRPTSVDALMGPGNEMRLAEVLAVTGAREEALEALARLVKIPFGLNYGNLKFSPYWDELRDDPRFEKILAESALPLPLDR